MQGAEIVSDGLPDVRVSGIRRIAVTQRFVVNQFFEHFLKFRRRWDIRVSDREIKDIVRAVFGLEPCALFEHLFDHFHPFDHFDQLICDRHDFLLSFL